MPDTNTLSDAEAWGTSQAPAPNSAPAAPQLDLTQARGLQPGDTQAQDVVGPGYYRDSAGTLYRDTRYAPGATPPPVPSVAPAPAPPPAVLSDVNAWGADAQAPAPLLPVPQMPATVAADIDQGARGFTEGVMGTAGMAMPQLPTAMLNQAADSTDSIAALMRAAMSDAPADGAPTPNLNPALPAFTRAGQYPLSVPAPVATWLAQAPQNAQERWARTAGQMLPMAAMPEDAAGIVPQIIARGARVVLPTVGSETARSVAAAAGADPNVQNIAASGGALLGGIGSGLRFSGPSGAAPVMPQVGQDIPAGAAQRAVAYVASRAPDVSNPTAAAAADAGKPVILAQRMGNGGTFALGALARRPGATADALQSYAADPQTGVLATQPQRLQQDFHAATGIDPVAASGDMEALSENLRTGVAAPLYTKALASPAPVWNPTLASLAQRPVIRQAMATAANSLRNAGTDPSQVGLAIDPATGAPVVGTDLSTTAEQQPTAQAWDLTKKVLGRMVQRDQFGNVVRSGDAGILNGDINTASQHLTGALRDAIPGYGDALDAGGDYLSLQKAFNDGQAHIATSSTSSRAVTRYVSALSPAERQAYAGGVANKLFEMGDNGKLNPRTYSTPAFQSKLAAAVGPDAAGKIITGAQQEAALSSSLQRTLPQTNSPTAMYAAEMAAQDTTPAWVKHGSEFVVNSALAGPHVATAKLGMGLVGKVPQLLSKPFQLSPAARDAAGRLLMSPTVTPEDLAAYMAAKRASQPSVRLALPMVP